MPTESNTPTESNISIEANIPTESPDIVLPDTTTGNDDPESSFDPGPMVPYTQQDMIDYVKQTLTELHTITCNQIKSHNLISEAVDCSKKQAEMNSQVLELLAGAKSEDKTKPATPGILDSLLETKELQQIVSQLKKISDSQTQIHKLMMQLTENDKTLMEWNDGILSRVDQLIVDLAAALRPEAFGCDGEDGGFPVTDSPRLD